MSYNDRRAEELYRSYEETQGYERSNTFDESVSQAYDHSLASYEHPSSGYYRSLSSSEPYYSEIEHAILRSKEPIHTHEKEEITAAGQRGIYVNKAEIAKWRGPLPIVNNSFFFYFLIFTPSFNLFLIILLILFNGSIIKFVPKGKDKSSF